MRCAVCDDTGWKPVVLDGVARVVRCDCWRQQANERAIESARIQKRYSHCELTNFEQHYDSLREAFRKASRFVDQFPVVDKGLLLHGSHGVGKTHLAVAILKAVIRSKGARAYFYDTGELLKLVRDTYASDTNEMDVLRPVIGADLLVLDDLGVEKTSEWVQEMLGHVVNIRYSERRPTVFTTNLIDSDDPLHPKSFLYRLGPRTRSRLFEMCDWVFMDAIDSREVGGPDATPEQIQHWQKHSPMSRENSEKSRGTLPTKAGGQLRARPRDRGGNADLKWPGGGPGLNQVTSHKSTRRNVRKPGAESLKPRAQTARPLTLIEVLGLYVHVPFCSAICNYCNFNRGLFDAALKSRYVEALLAEIHRAGDGSAADTIYFGGGTPSLLEPSEIATIVDACRRAFDVAPDAEVTLEANPETTTSERLAGFRQAGINRLSYGVQSFRDEELRRLSRLHSAARAVDAFGSARAAGFDNVSLDLMMWLPQQSVAEWLESVDALIALAPEHASMYLLEIYPNAPLRDAMARGGWSPAPDDDAAEMYLRGLERMDAAGYRQYEISNVARPGRESRHNLKYWTDGEWLGFGCGAHSTRRGVRSRNIASTEEYISTVAAGGQPVADRRSLSEQEHFEEAMFMALRLADGVDLETVRERHGVDLWPNFRTELQPFVDAGLLVYDDRSLKITRPGMLLAHEVMAVFIRTAVR